MLLSYIWVGFIVLSFLAAFYQYLVGENVLIFQGMVSELFRSSQAAVMDLALPLVGTMAFWLGMMKIAERVGLVEKFSRRLYPFFSNLFPDIPKGHPSFGHMTMNFAANLLGLDNAATPFGLRAMQSLQEINPDKSVASRAQMMFVLLHASGLTLIPVSVMAQRAIYGAANPSDVFIPIAISTAFTTLVSLMITAFWQGIRWRLRFVLGLLGCMLMLAFVVFGMYYATHLREREMSIFLEHLPSTNLLQTWTKAQWQTLIPHIETYTKTYTFPLSSEHISLVLQHYVTDYKNHPNLLLGNVLILVIPVLLVSYALFKKRNVFEDFVEGAKESFSISLKIIPYLVGMLVAISFLRVSGLIELCVSGLGYLMEAMHLNTNFVPALSTALMKPLSGMGARAMMIEAMQTYGADSFVGKLSSIFQGTSETLLYVVTLYFGSVGICKTKYAIGLGLLIDVIGLAGAIVVGYWFFG